MRGPRTSPIWWEDAKTHLRNVDSKMGQIMDSVEFPPLQGFGDIVITLCNAVVGQQISSKAAESIWTRFIDLIGGEFNSNIVIQLDEHSLRNVGLSRMKIRTLKEICECAEFLRTVEWELLTEEDIQSILTKTWGVGPWTAQMAMIFSLHLPDIFPEKDIGIIRSIEAMQGKKDINQIELLNFAEIWRPYRTCAVWYLWRQHDADPVLY